MMRFLAGSNEAIIEYVKEKHGLDVRVIENTGPKN